MRLCLSHRTSDWLLISDVIVTTTIGESRSGERGFQSLIRVYAIIPNGVDSGRLFADVGLVTYDISIVRSNQTHGNEENVQT